MFGSLSDFIDVEMPLVESKNLTLEYEEDKITLVDQMFKKRVNSNFH